MGYYQTVSTEDRFNQIMKVLKTNAEFLTASEICNKYLTEYTSSDVGSAGQILKVLALAGIVERKIFDHPYGKRKVRVTYKLVA